MRSWILGLVVVFAGASVAAADEKAEAVVKKAIEAHGGAAALDKYKAGKFNMKGELSIMGLDIAFTGKLAFMSPDKYKMEMDAEIMGQKMTVQQVVNGDKTKNKVTFGGMTIPVPDNEKEELKMAVAMQEAENLTPLLDSKKFEITAVADEDVEGSKASVVSIKIKALNKEAKFYFDQKTNLLVKTAHKGKGPGDGGEPKEVMEESLHKDYKKVNGVQTATKMVVSHDGKKFMTIDASDIELLEKIEDKEFAIDD
jgi:hypothetical protein